MTTITPATLRKQWSGELAEKFFLPSGIMEKKVFDETLKRSSLTNPFAQESAIIDGKMFEILDSERCEQLLSLGATAEPPHSTLPENAHQYLRHSHTEQQAHFADEANLRTMRFYDEQNEKLDTWEDDALSAYTLQMKSIKDLIKLRKGEMKTITTAAEKIAAQRGIQELQQRYNDLQREQFQAQIKIAEQKKTLLDDLEQQIEQQLHVRELFTMQWRII
ncbi:MAG: hypothetical protein ACOVSW_10160 [Candidatus Kapaibacteriota bacterium]